MSDLQISLKNIRNTKSLYVEDMDTTFQVRRLGAGEELDLSKKLRRLNEIMIELQSIKIEPKDNPTEEETKALEKVAKKIQKLSDEISEIREYEFNTHVKLFDDGGDGSKSRELLSALPSAELSNILKSLFEEKKEEDE